MGVINTNTSELNQLILKTSQQENKETILADVDSGIRTIVRVLIENGIETYESCQGGDGHSFPEPTVRFHGEREEGFRVLAVALLHNLHPFSLRRHWQIIDGEPHGPEWEMTFTLEKEVMLNETFRLWR